MLGTQKDLLKRYGKELEEMLGVELAQFNETTIFLAAPGHPVTVERVIESNPYIKIKDTVAENSVDFWAEYEDALREIFNLREEHIVSAEIFFGREFAVQVKVLKNVDFEEG